MADKLAAVIDSALAKIPGQVFTQSKNLQLSFPASSKKIIQEKAKGKVVIYNAFSSSPQTLVATTRLLTPDGKLFRLVNDMLVPGAQIVDGRIVPSSIEATVVADKAGEAFNVDSVAKFTIPGLKGTPKYDAFYAESKTPITGGFVGEVIYPSDSDIAKAKSELNKKIEEALIAGLRTQIPREFKMLNGAYKITYGKPTVNTNADSDGNFIVFNESKAEVIVFKESDLQAMLAGRVQSETGPDFGIKTFELSYGEARADFDRDVLSFPIKFKSIIARKIDPQDLKKKLSNKSEADLKALLFALPGLDSAQISLWPFWVQKAPSNPDKIIITVD